MEKLFEILFGFLRHWSQEQGHRLDNIERKLNKIIMTQAELVTQLNTITAQVAKIGVETGNTLQQVIDLKALLAAGGTVTPEVIDAVTALQAQAQKTDDLVPDAPATPSAKAP